MHCLSKLVAVAAIVAPFVSAAPAAQKCVNDDLLKVLEAIPVIAKPFCSLYTKPHATVTFPPELQKIAKKLASQVSSGCTCLNGPATTSAVKTTSSSVKPTSSSKAPSSSSPTPTSSSKSSSVAPSSSPAPTSTSSSTSSSSSSSSSSVPASSSSSGPACTNPSTTVLASKTGVKPAVAAASLGLYYGTAADIPGTGEAADANYRAILDDAGEFNQITPANTMKWQYTEPSRGVFDFSGADQFMAVAEANGQIVRCHNLVWHNQLPNWVTAGNFDNATLISILQNHITNVVTHFGDRCKHWDVVNEAVDDTATWRTDVFYNTIGPAYIQIAFAAAAAAASPNTKLYYNDYNIEYNGAKAQFVQQNIVAPLKAAGIRIDGVGLQSHFIVGQTPSASSQSSNMQNFINMGVEVAITELDVRVNPMPPTVAQQKQQAVDFYNSVYACVITTGCVGVTVWDFDDKYSWIPSTFKGQGWGTPFFEPCGTNDKVAKYAYDGIVNAFTGAGAPSTA